MDQVEAVAYIIHRADPLGVGASSTTEALLVQLDILGNQAPSQELCARTIREGMAFLSKHQYAELGHLLGVSKTKAQQIGEFAQACKDRDVPTSAFPFTRDGYVIHLGRGTLAGLLARDETSHPLFDWARDHHEPHFQSVEGAGARYSDIVAEFEREVGDLTAASLIGACRRRRSS